MQLRRQNSEIATGITFSKVNQTDHKIVLWLEEVKWLNNVYLENIP